MLYKENQTEELSQDIFRNPPAEYRGTPFWSWNCEISEELIHSQISVFHKMGFGGAHLHPRTGLETEYLGEEFLRLVQYADEQMKERGMLCWLYDEDRYPSGAAGGIVTEDWRFRAKHLLLTREKKEGMCASREEFWASVARGEKPAGYYLCHYRIKTRDGYLQSYRCYRQEEKSGKAYDEAENVALNRKMGQAVDGRICAEPQAETIEERQEGRLWIAYVEWMRESPWFNDQTYVDVMNQEAVRRFLEVTHEKYYAKLGEEFGKSIPAIFTDEPQIKGSMALADGESEADVTLSYTEDLPETFAARYGTDLLEVLPELLWDWPENRASVHRYYYHDHLAERFVSAYSDTIADWCEAHHIAMTGHYMSEPTLYSQTLRLGEAMRCYRKQQLPGVDILCGDPEYSTLKQAVSVARQKGREGVLSELYGVTHWDFDFKGHKLQGDWQAALGVSIRCHHLALMSMEGEAKRDWPASISYQSPWWEKYSYIENYFARVNTAMTRGQAQVSVAVVHPIESYWISYGPVAQTGALRDQMDANFRDLIDWLLFGLTDFDFLSESMLPEEETGVEENAVLRVGRMCYRTVIVPGLRTIRATTLELLEAFAAAGGRVMFLGEIPALVDGVPSERAQQLAARTERLPYSAYALEQALQEERDIEIRGADGRRSSNLFYQMRRDGGCRWLFVCHVRRENDMTDRGGEMTIRLRGHWDVTEYDALSGEIRPMAAICENGWTVVKRRMYHEDSLLWKLEAAEETAKTCRNNGQGGSEKLPQEQKGETGVLQSYGLVAGVPIVPPLKETVLAVIGEPESGKRTEPNVLLLDQAQWKLDEGEWHAREEILRLDNQIRTIVGYPHRQDAYLQPWRIRNAPEEHTVTLRYEMKSRIATEHLRLAMERPDKARIYWNGGEVKGHTETGHGGECGQNVDWYVDSFLRIVDLPGLQQGRNELVLVIPYGRKTNLENLYLLGNFGVCARGTQAEIVPEPEKLFFGDISRQGLSFYGGSIDYEMRFVLENEEEIQVRVPHFNAPVLEVWIDGEEAGVIAFSPHTLALGRRAAGEHSLRIRAYGNRFNTFGTLHNCDPEFKWYGPDSYRTGGGQWSEAWQLRPFGILSRVEILRGEE
ncbi:MAG: glycosyl hydrolase [Eubacteriales bacterium]|nr:glycosyl hydrolase [Eubacteriales bacterium]